MKSYFPFDLSFPLGLPDGLFPAPVILSLADFVPANIGCISENILKYNLRFLLREKGIGLHEDN